jgi:hypothetical protein
VTVGAELGVSQSTVVSLVAEAVDAHAAGRSGVAVAHEGVVSAVGVVGDQIGGVGAEGDKRASARSPGPAHFGIEGVYTPGLRNIDTGTRA